MARVTGIDILVLVAAGFGAGLTGSIAGLASLISYPALLAVGLSPLAANVTNTVALISNGVGSSLGSREELAGQRRRMLTLSASAVVGGAIGGLLLLLTPADAFERAVPWLILFASLAILLRRKATGEIQAHHVDSTGVQIGVVLIGVYGGYFGAAAGVLLLALLLASSRETLARSNALKNVVLAAANAVAAVAFIVFGPVHWAAAVPLAAGLLIGSRLGPVVVRHSPAELLQRSIALAGIGLALYLGYTAYR